MAPYLSAVSTREMRREDTNIGFVLYNNDQLFRSQVFHPSLAVKRRVVTGNLMTENALDFVNITMKVGDMDKWTGQVVMQGGAVISIL